MTSTRGRRRAVLAASLLVLVATACSRPASSGRSTMMGGSSGMALAAQTCSTPRPVPAPVVTATLVDMGMNQRMGGVAPRSGRMRLTVDHSTVSAGTLTLVAANRGWRTHELVLLPLSPGASVGERSPDAQGRIDETGSVGEASASCAPGAGEGITSGAVGWVTVTLEPGRYELVCNLPNHYADGMYAELDVR